jgi:hypothetical protein
VSYPERLAALVEALGSYRAVSRALGVGHATLQHRIAHPEVIRREHELALEALERRLR